MRTLRHFYTGLAFSAALLTFNCTTSDSGDFTADDMATADAGNQVVDIQKDEVHDSEIPNPEQVAAETQKASDMAGEAIDNNSSNAIQDLASDQQAAQKGPQLPEGNPDEASDYQMANDQKTAQPVSEAEAAPSSSDSLPSLSQVVAESDTPAAAPVKGKKAKKEKVQAVAATDASVPAPEAPAPAMDNSAADAGMAADSAPAKAPKAKGKKAKAHRPRGLSGSEKLSGNFYIVQPGDTLGSISTVIYGTSKRWQELASANSLDSNTPIFPGDVLRYPADGDSAQFEAAYKGLPRSKTVVQKGDTLSLIAERQLGNKDFWKLLWRWNESTIAEPNKIFEGQSLEFIAPQELSALLSDRKGLKPAH